ncbi:MAG: cyclophilin-like fold protein [Candidatus Bipolaricaulis sp.]|nr:cyclophilin-like fold protein [Candidatus Bipolaricaulis sp.]
MKRFELQFESGDRFTAVLLEMDAPRTAKVFWDNIPHEAVVKHAKFSGEEIYFFLNEGANVEPENRLEPIAGDICYEAAGRPVVVIYYGNNIHVWAHGDHHLKNRFARIEGDLDTLHRVGERVHVGAEKVAVRRL